MHDITRIETAFDRDAMQRVCTMPEAAFGEVYSLDRHMVTSRYYKAPEDFYFYADRGSNILAVAHLDTVGPSDQRDCHFMDTAAGEVVYSRALDDRLGAYIILELLPKLGINYDILLTVGEESGNSTAGAFMPDKQYDWMIEFDRGGTDVVMYQYDDTNTREAVRRSGARVGDGSFSDIAFLDHLDVKGFNWGVGYRDYHGPRAHAYLDDTFQMLAYYLRFHRANHETPMPHVSDRSDWWSHSISDEDDEDVWTADIVDVEEFDDDGLYFDREYIENPTPEQIRRAAEAESRARLW